MFVPSLYSVGTPCRFDCAQGDFIDVLAFRDLLAKACCDARADSVECVVPS